MKKNHFFFSLLLVFFILSLLAIPIFIKIQHLSLQTLPTYSITNAENDLISAVKIEDIEKYHQIDSYNLFLDSDKIKDNKQNTKDAGTIAIVLLNLDPLDEQFEQKANSLKPFLQKDNQWHFTLYLPPIFVSSRVYLNDVLIASNTLKNQVAQPLFIDLPFSTFKEELLHQPSLQRNVITIHFESQNVDFTKENGTLLVGLDEMIREVIKRDIFFIYAVVLISIFILALFIFVSILKRTHHYLPQIVGIIGIFLLSTSLYELYNGTNIPFFWIAFFKSSFLIVCLSGCMDLFKEKKNKGKKSLFMGCYAFLFIISFIVEYFYLQTLILIVEIIQLIIAFGIFIIALIRIYLHHNHKQYLQIILMPSLVLSLCIQKSTLIYLSAFFYFALLILLIIAFLGMKEFILLEQTNRYLMNNMQEEVKIQTKNLQTLIEEKDTILRYVSHDMKKPIQGIHNDLKLLKINPNDEKQFKAFEGIALKSSQIAKSLEDLAKYEKNNFVLEESHSLSCKKIIQTVYEVMKPDCDANGIEFSIHPLNFNIYGKENNLISILTNLVLNAIEHANCTKIMIQSFKIKEKGYIEIIDNGKGIKNQVDIFQPYYSENQTDENRGLGLYISKKFIQSMDGDITYRNENNHLIFTITLPLA